MVFFQRDTKIAVPGRTRTRPVRVFSPISSGINTTQTRLLFYGVIIRIAHYISLIASLSLCEARSSTPCAFFVCSCAYFLCRLRLIFSPLAVVLFAIDSTRTNSDGTDVSQRKLTIHKDATLRHTSWNQDNINTVYFLFWLLYNAQWAESIYVLLLENASNNRLREAR